MSKNKRSDLTSNDLVKVTDDDFFEILEAFRENLKFLKEEGLIISMREFTKVKLAVQILEQELSHRNKTKLKMEKRGRFIIFSRKKDG